GRPSRTIRKPVGAVPRSASTSKSSSFRSPEGRLAEARLRISWSISALLPIGCADNRDCTERKKERAKNISIPCPSGDCAEQRHQGEQSRVARLGVHSCVPIRKGQQLGSPFSASGWP